jgi:rhodanese-related sulfurtransferase
MSSSVSAVPAASADRATFHFGAAFEFETDCADVFDAVSRDRKIVDIKMRDYPGGTLFVVYCAGPHCNGAHRAAYRLAKLGRPVKLTAGGVTGWVHEGFALERGEAA